ncbi:MAG: hypothetical protein BA863_13140 [Desulfovibrio sp. S3730MH75]|nr:MAG: hypothetical protein BA863_13140 [Desulfovibrio sp. S3730MH75]
MNKLKLATKMCLVVCLSMLVSGYGTALAGKAQTFYFFDGAYSLDFPAEWEVVVDKDLTANLSPSVESDSLLMIFPPDPDPVYKHVAVTTYAESFMDSLFSQGSNGKIIHKEMCKLSNRDAYSVVYSIEMEGESAIGGAYFMLDDGIAYTLLALVPEAQVNSAMPLISDAADSFKIYPAGMSKMRDQFIAVNAME